MKTIRFWQHPWCADCSLERRGVVLWNEYLPVNYLCLFSRAITYFMMFSRDGEYPPLILDGDELYLKISLKGILNSQMSSAPPSEKRLILERMCGTVGLSPSSRACRTINHNGLMQTRNSQAWPVWVYTRAFPSWKASHFKRQSGEFQLEKPELWIAK